MMDSSHISSAPQGQAAVNSAQIVLYFGASAEEATDGKDVLRFQQAAKILDHMSYIIERNREMAAPTADHPILSHGSNKTVALSKTFYPTSAEQADDIFHLAKGMATRIEVKGGQPVDVFENGNRLTIIAKRKGDLALHLARP